MAAAGTGAKLRALGSGIEKIAPDTVEGRASPLLFEALVIPPVIEDPEPKEYNRDEPAEN